MDKTTLLDAALLYAEKGWAVFPLKPQSKLPATAHGFKDATTDADQIRQWWSENQSYNIGIATGEMSDIAVVDVDGQVGEESLATLEQELGTLPQTVTQITPGKKVNGLHTGKGQHLIFRTNGQSFRCRTGIAKGIDIKADGGYIVAASSVHPDGTGTYEFAEGRSFDDMEPAELPPAWIAFLQSKKRPAKAAVTEFKPPVFATDLTPEIEERAIAILNESDPAVQGNAGHNALLSVAFKLVRGLLIDPTLAANLAWKHYNPRCSPPWSDEERQDFDRKFTEAATLPLQNREEGWLLHAAAGSNLLMPVVGEPCLQDILRQTKRVNFLKEVGKKVSRRDHVVVCIDQIQKLVQGQTSGLCARNEQVFCYTGSHWKVLEDADFIAFLTAGAIRMGVPRVEAKHHTFGAELLEQFLSVAHLPTPVAIDETKINLKNGTFVVSKGGGILQPFDPADFLTYQLPFEYDQRAAAPMFHQYLNRVLPEQELQDILAEYVGYIFARDLKLEKVALLYGGGANGKSVFADILNALLGKENVCGFSLQTLTKHDSWQRAELEHKLLNYSSEISSKMDPEVFKKMVSGEPVEAHRKYKDPFTMYHYARMMFNCNLLPHEVELTDGFFRRLLIVPFRVQIPPAEQYPDLAKLIIASELSGVFNWVLTGLNRLLKQRKFSVSPIVEELVKKYRTESDTVALFLQAKNIRPGTQKVRLKYLRQQYVEFCGEYDYRPVGAIKFSGRLRNLGFEDGREGGGMVFYCDRQYGPVFIKPPPPKPNAESADSVG